MSSLKEDLTQESKEFVNDFLGCLFSPFCILMMLGILGLILWIIIASVFNLSYAPENDKTSTGQSKIIVFDYIKSQEPTAKIKSISSSPLNSSVTVVQGQFKKKNAFGQWAVHQFRASIKDGKIVDFHTDFIGFE